ncbi:MAG: hypothetical protein GSR80_000133 [Desulfurococcales archaeon]|nr:hypothetical protein [Desulfurococcales archaeon]
MWRAAAIAVAALMLAAPLLALHTQASGASGAWARLQGDILYLGNDFATIEINLSRGASIALERVLGDVILNCTRGANAGFHLDFYTSQSALESSKYSPLATGKWKAVVVENTSRKVVVRLEPAPSTAREIAPLKVEVYIEITDYTPFAAYNVTLYNPSTSPISLYARSPGGVWRGIKVYYGTCLTVARHWEFTAAYGALESPSVYTLRASNRTVRSQMLPVNGTFIGAAILHLSNASTPLTIGFITGDSISYYSSTINPVGPVTIEAYTALATLEPGQRYTALYKAALTPFNPALLLSTDVWRLAYALYPGLFTSEYVHESNYYKTVSRLNASIAKLNASLASYKSSYKKCLEENSKLKSRNGELEELFNTCRVNLNIAKNDAAKYKRIVDRYALRVGVFTTLGIIVGVAGGYIFAAARASSAPLGGRRRRR